MTLYQFIWLTTLLLRYCFVCLFIFRSDVSLACYVCVCTYLQRITALCIHTMLLLSVLDVHSHTIPHVHAGGPLSLCAHVCTHSHTICAHGSLSQRKGGGVSIFPSPFFGDNDGHFFFSVTDDRQN